VSDEAKDLTEDAAIADEAVKADTAQDETARDDAIRGDAATAGLPGEESDATTPEADEEQAEVEEIEEEEEEEDVYIPEPPAPVLTPEEQAAALAAQMDWYILKVQSNRENSIVDALHRRVAVAGLEPYFGEVIVPVEMVTEFKGGKKKIVKRKLYPGYIVVQMVVNEETWFLVRETPGVGDFTGAGGKPTPMSPQDVEKIRPKVEADTSDSPRLKIDFKPTDKVKINDGTFENFEGEVSTIDEASGRVTVMINIFGRSTPVELEYWQVEKV
jgi:transcription termination/antitermination protein NusG